MSYHYYKEAGQHPERSHIPEKVVCPLCQFLVKKCYIEVHANSKSCQLNQQARAKYRTVMQ